MPDFVTLNHMSGPDALDFIIEHIRLGKRVGFLCSGDPAQQDACIKTLKAKLPAAICRAHETDSPQIKLVIVSLAPQG